MKDYEVYERICRALVILSSMRSKKAREVERILREALKFVGGEGYGGGGYKRGL